MTFARMFRTSAFCLLPCALAMSLFKLLHELHQRLDARFGKGVVNRGPDAPNRAVALETVEARGGGRLGERGLQRFGWKAERHVHPRARIFLGVRFPEAGAIELRVEHGRLAL